MSLAGLDAPGTASNMTNQTLEWEMNSGTTDVEIMCSDENQDGVGYSRLWSSHPGADQGWDCKNQKDQVIRKRMERVDFDKYNIQIDKVAISSYTLVKDGIYVTGTNQ